MGSDNIHLGITAALTAMLIATVPLFPEHWYDFKAPCLCFLMSFTHYMLYPYIWYYPQHYMKFVAGDRGVEFYRDFVFVQKMAICALTAVWWFDQDLFQDTLATTNGKMLYALAIAMIALGTHLNHQIYEKIGAVGVYYGFKLGRHVPWVTGYPFNVWRHPQYFGAWCIFAGYGIMVNYNHPAIWITTIFQAWAYAVTGIMEESSDNFEEQEIAVKKKMSPAGTPEQKKRAKKIA